MVNQKVKIASSDRAASVPAAPWSGVWGGSLQSKTCPDGKTTYDYDAFGNLRHVGLPNGTAIDYVIDGQNRRVGKKINGIMTEGFLYRGQLQPVAWLNGDGSIKAIFSYGLKRNVPEYMTMAGVKYRLVTDQLGSVRLVLDANGNPVERIDYDEFGNVTSDAAAGTQPFGFAGGVKSVESLFVHFGARDYDAAAARWTAKDPILFGGGTMGLYEYAGNDPVNQNDPTGLTVSCIYNKSAGQLTCVDDTTGSAAGGPAESGGKPYGDPIPDGTYEILSREGRSGFFRLDPIDSNPRNDVDDASGRDHFRLHHPGRTIGCIAAQDADTWNSVEALIRNTTGTFEVRDRAQVPWYTPSHWRNTPRYLTYYGTLTVKSR